MANHKALLSEAASHCAEMKFLEPTGTCLHMYICLFFSRNDHLYSPGLNTTTIFTIFPSARLRKLRFFAILVIFALHFVKLVASTNLANIHLAHKSYENCDF